MPRIFGRVFGKGAGLAHARSAELRGDLAHAAVLFAQAGRLDESARVMVLRGDAETDPHARVRHYVQAVATAPPGTAIHVHATRKRAATVLAIAAGASLTEALRQDVSDAAVALEAIGDHARAAEAYAQVGDLDGQVRALTRAGEIERLDAILAQEQGRERDRRARRSAHEEVAALAAAGRRREAAALARASDDDGLRQRGAAFDRRRITGAAVTAVLRGRRLRIALGDEVVVGRQPGPSGGIEVPSSAVSRRHVALARRGDAVVVRDLGSRNGTALRGLAVSGEVAVGDGIELRLGGEVPLVVRPAEELPGAVRVDVGGISWVAPLGKAWLGVGRWRLERGDDDWVELVTDGDPAAFLGPMLLGERVSLLEGDAIATERAGAAVLELRPEEPT